MSEVAQRHAPDESDQADYSNEEYDAGVETLAERFGFALALDAAAGGNVLNYPTVLATDADTVLLKLTMLGAQTSYQRRLQKLLSKSSDR